MKQAGTIKKRIPPLKSAPRDGLVLLKCVLLHEGDEKLQEIADRMQLEGYSLRKRSLWINEAIQSLSTFFWVENREDQRNYISIITAKKRGGKSIKVKLKGAGLEAFNGLESAFKGHGITNNAATHVINMAINMRLRMAPRPIARTKVG